MKESSLTVLPVLKVVLIGVSVEGRHKPLSKDPASLVVRVGSAASFL